MKDTTYNIWDVLKFQCRFIVEEKRYILFLIYGLEPIVFGLTPVLMIVFPSMVIDAITNNNLQDVYQWSLLLGGSMIVLYSLHHTMNGVMNGNLMGLRFRAGKRFNERYRLVAYNYLEDAEFQANRSTALQALRGGLVGFEGLYRYYLRVLTGCVSLAGLFIIVGVFNIWIIFLAFGLSILQYVITLRGKQYSFAHRDELNERQRKASYFFKIGHDFSYGKDIRADQMDRALYTKHKEKSRLFTRLLKQIEEYEMRLSYWNVLFMLLINGTTYYLVIQAYFNQLVTIGELTMIIWAITAISIHLQSMFTEFANIKKESGYVSDFMSFLDNESYFPQPGGTVRDFSSFRIQFKDVSFRYPGSDINVLEDLNLTIEANEKLALVGINGAGKSTIVKLLCGFYQPTSGEILIDGIDINELDMEAYRNQLSVVFQEVNIYAGTVMENIAGDQVGESSKASVWKALDMVGLKDKVMKYPDKEHQPLLKIIDDNGTDLSGGEAQRLAIARAIYKDHTNAIVLDEPTASLDALHEKEIYDHFQELIQGRTSIIISHRLASTKFCDNIAFLEHGKIVEYGSHQELMARPNGKYHEMFITQGKYYQKEGETHA